MMWHNFLNGPSPSTFVFIFGLFQTNITILRYSKFNVKNGYPVYSAGIQTNDLQNVSRIS